MHRPGIEPGAGRRLHLLRQMATANFTTKPPMLAEAMLSGYIYLLTLCLTDLGSVPADAPTCTQQSAVL
jgi:hypothetical protein